MSRFDQIFTFKHESEPHILLRVLNYGSNSDELKFTFLDKRFQRGVTYTNESLNLKGNDIITDYGEITYHSDGSVLWKHPRYPVESKKYINPKEEGYKRKKLSEITDWEPIAQYEVFDYGINRIDDDYIQEKEKKIHLLANEIVFNGQPFKCLINLVHKDYKTPNFNNPTEEILRIPGVTNSLHLWIVISKTTKRGNYLKVEGMDEEFFTTSNIIQVQEKNT